MGLFDSSKSSNTNNLTENTSTVTQQKDQSGNSGLNFADTGALSLAFNTSSNLSSYESNVVSDSGAIGAGRDLGLAGIKAGADALSTVAKMNNDGLSVLSALASSSIDASKTLARDSAANNATFLQSAVSGFGALAKQTSEGSDDKIARVVGFALAAIAAVIVLPQLFKGGARGVIA